MTRRGAWLRVLTVLGVIASLSIVRGAAPASANPSVDPAVVAIGNAAQQANDSYVNAQKLADTLVSTSVDVNAADGISIVDPIDLSTSSLGTPHFNLTLVSPVCNIDRNINLAAVGDLVLDCGTLNLNAQITSGGTTIAPGRVTGTATQVNVLSQAANIQQAIDASSSTSRATVQVSPGHYAENLTIEHALTLSGKDGTSATGADPTAPTLVGTQPGGNVITVNANNVTIDGLHLNGDVVGTSSADSVDGIVATGVDGLTIAHNTFDGFSGLSIATPGSTNVVSDANDTLIDPGSVSIGNAMQQLNGTYLNCQKIADNLVSTSINVQATGGISIVDSCDLSTSTMGTPHFNLSLVTPTVNFNNDLNLAASGNLFLTTSILNLGAQITSGGTTIDPARVTSTATQVNVLSNAASIQQTMDVSSPTSPVVVQLSSGQYDENLNITRQDLSLTGNDGIGPQGADPTAPTINGTVAGGNVVTVSANGVDIDGLQLNGEVNGGSSAPSVNGIYANGVDSLTIAHNTFDGFSGPTIATPGSTNVTDTANLVTSDTVAFDSEGGSAVSSISGPDGNSITLPSDTFPGYSFDGWFTAASGGTEVGGAGSSYTIPSGGVTLFAQWTANATDDYSFNAAGGTPTPSSGAGLDGTTITLPGAPTRAGYTFTDWSDGTTTYGSGATYTLSSDGAPIVLTAQWAPNATDDYSYAANGGTGSAPASGSGLDGTTITLAANTFADPGYAFAGWSDGTTTYAAGATYTLSSDGAPIVFTAQWSANATDDYSYAANGGTGTAPTSGSGLDGTTITLAANTFTYPGHTFGAWNDGSATFVAGATYTLSSDGAPIVFTAQWVANATDTITFNSEGGSSVPSQYRLQGSTITLPGAGSRAGYAFDGWFVAPSGGSALTSLYTVVGSVTLYAQWTGAPTTAVLVPSKGATVSGTATTLDASASNATSVEFLLFGGTYGYNAPTVCSATLTYYGWVCNWNTTTVPNGSYVLVSQATGADGSNYSSGVSMTVNNPPPTTSVLIPAKGATLSGTAATLDASASNATSVEFLLFGGSYGFSAPVVCTATPTYYGWLCAWNTTTVPDGSYVLVSEAFNSTTSAFSSGVSVTVKN